MLPESIVEHAQAELLFSLEFYWKGKGREKKGKRKETYSWR